MVLSPLSHWELFFPLCISFPLLPRVGVREPILHSLVADFNTYPQLRDGNTLMVLGRTSAFCWNPGHSEREAKREADFPHCLQLPGNSRIRSPPTPENGIARPGNVNRRHQGYPATSHPSLDRTIRSLCPEVGASWQPLRGGYLSQTTCAHVLTTPQHIGQTFWAAPPPT